MVRRIPKGKSGVIKLHSVDNVAINHAVTDIMDETLASLIEPNSLLIDLLKYLIPEDKASEILSEIASGNQSIMVNNTQIESFRYHNNQEQHLVLLIKIKGGASTPDHPVFDFLKNVIRYSPGYMYLKDIEFKYILCNEEFAKAAGLDCADDILGKTDYDLAWKDTEADNFRAGDVKALSGTKLLDFEETQLQSDGTTKIVLANKVPLYDSDNNLIGILGNYYDITDRKKLEQDLQDATEKAEYASKAKSEFIANMSHDIRTPVSGIVGLSDILMDNVVSDESKEYARMLNLSGVQLLSLLNSVLDIVSSDSVNQEDIVLSSFSIHDLLHNIFELELPALKLKNLSLELNFDENIPPIIKTDKGKLYRILLNLLSNSIKFSEEGLISIDVTLLNQQADKMVIEVVVSDTGIGIPKTEVNKIFEAFYRVHPSYEGNYTGHGVGLHLVKQYVALLDGNISVKSIEGMGTKFHLQLTVFPGDLDSTDDTNLSNREVDAVLTEINQEYDVTEPKQTKQGQESERGKSHVSVLVVEDNPMAMKVADMILTNNGARTDQAYNSHDALELFKRNTYDFVLADIGLPDYSGFELAQKMKAFESQQNREKFTPIVGLTAHAKEEAVLKGNQCGMVEVCEKPLTVKTAITYIDMFGANQNKQAISKDALPDSCSSEIALLDVELGSSQLGSIDELKEMLKIMLDQSMVVTVKEIERCYQSRDWEAFEKQVHKFKSSCLYCATTKLLKLTQELEGLADSKDLEKIKPVYQAFSNCLISTRQYIEVWLSNQ